MSGTDARICILDDDSSVLRSVQVLLASDGSEAEVFDSPNKFLSYARDRAVKVAVLDVWMPEANGIEVQKRLHELSPGTRVIMITGREAASTRADALKGGAFAFLTKPFDDEAFLNAVHRALANDP
jgi:FixJ family two-component response regulator